MAKSIQDIPNKRGRGRPKTTGRGEGILVRLYAHELARLDAWAAQQEDAPLSRPEALRRLAGFPPREDGGTRAASPAPVKKTRSSPRKGGSAHGRR
jgi:hypothetical protein